MRVMAHPHHGGLGNVELGLRGRVALVAGGSQGIGRAAALELAREGARVAICGRREDAVQQAASSIGAALPGTEVLAVSADVTHADDLERLASTVLDRFGPVEVLVNAVGHGYRKPFSDLTDADWQASYDVNLLSAVRLTRRVLPGMLDAGWGRVVNVAAVSGRQPTPGQIASNASKAALLNVTKSLSNDAAERGVTVNAVLPGRITSERVLREFTAEQREHRARAIPMRRYGTPEEFAAAIVFLASARASYITGVALAVDGGLVSAMF